MWSEVGFWYVLVLGKIANKSVKNVKANRAKKRYEGL